jgi:hypothetical protein
MRGKEIMRPPSRSIRKNGEEKYVKQIGVLRTRQNDEEIQGNLDRYKVQKNGWT